MAAVTWWSRLRDDGLVETKVGAGAVVSALMGRKQPVGVATPLRPRRASVPRQALSRRHALRAAIAIADTEGLDAEGLDAVSMRRLAAEFGVGPMSLYRHVASKDELVTQMTDEVFGEPELHLDGFAALVEDRARSGP
ncbi:TetR/AcrR family transcriptional regulator [Nonomuraea sp. LPB2021202275-12-8]|uniref:TetR/AcrR family transcriptional regulator n=1 Tax=Nonomuraea sp. LPB2021202275-12-8 TaxID=3120159 RepID=UPI00300CC097